MRKFEDITQDIGMELKESAARVYKVGISIQTGILVLALVGAIFASLDEGFLLFLVIAGSAFVEYLIGCGIIYSVAVHRYAEGEKLHLLETVAENTQPVPESKPEEVKPAVPASGAVRPASAATAPAPFRPIGQVVANKPATPPDGWKCACGKVNPPYISTCVCGRNKRDQMNPNQGERK